MASVGKVSVLIINENWGLGYSDGIPSVNRLIANILGHIEVDQVYSTVLEYNGKEEEEARNARVSVQSPQPKERRFRDHIYQEPNPDWLYLHDTFYPQLKELQGDIKFVFGYSLTTAEAAVKIKQDLFSDAALYLINVWNPGSMKAEIIGWDDEELDQRKKETAKWLRNSHVVSVGENVYQHYSAKQPGYAEERHFLLQPTQVPGQGVTRKYVRHKHVNEFKLLTVFESQNIQDYKAIRKDYKAIRKAIRKDYKAIRKAIRKDYKAIRDVFCDMVSYFKGTKIRWVMVGDIREKEDHIRRVLDLEDEYRFDLILKPCYSVDDLDDYLLDCHLALPRRDARISDPFVWRALSLGTPLVLQVPCNSDFITFIGNKLGDYKSDLTTAEDNPEQLGEKVKDKMENYDNAVDTAAAIRTIIKEISTESNDKLREKLMAQVKHAPNVPWSTQEEGSEGSDVKDDKAGAFPSLEKGDGTEISGDAKSMSQRSLPALAIEQGPEESDVTDDKAGAFSLESSVDAKSTSQRSSLALAIEEGSKESDVTDDKTGVLSSVAECLDKESSVDSKSGSQPSTLAFAINEGAMSSGQRRLQEERGHHGSSDDTIDLHITLGGCIPEVGHTATEVSESLYNMDQSSKENNMTVKEIEKRYSHTKVSPPEKGSIKYSIKCATPDALAKLWKSYQNGELRHLVQRTLVTKKMLQRTHAMSMTLRVSIDDSEYRKCLRKLKGMPKTDLTDSSGTSTGDREEITGELSAEREGKKERIRDVTSEVEVLTKEKKDLSEKLRVLEGEKESYGEQISIIETKTETISKEKELLLSKITDLSEQVRTMKPKVDYIHDTFEMTILGGPGKHPGQFNHPSGIAVNQDGNLVIADKSNRRVQVIGWNNVFKHEYAPQPKDKEVFRPRDVAVSVRGTYFVTDHGKWQIVVCNEKNEVENSFGEDIDPYGITLTKDDHVLVNDRHKDNIRKYTKKGELVAMFGSKGSGPREFNFPWSVVENSKKQILVSDQNNHRVQVLEPDGAFVLSMGSEGHGEGELYNPYGIDVDDSDNVYVCDNGNSRIVKFSPEGKFVRYIGEGKVSPRYIVVNKDKGPLRVAVTDWQDNCIKVFMV